MLKTKGFGANPALVPTPSSPQAVSTKGFNPGYRRWAMQAKITVERHAECPSCEHGYFTIVESHSGAYGPWGCDTCGARYRFNISPDAIEITPEPESDIPGWLVLRIAGSEPPIYMVKDHMLYAGYSAKMTEESRRSQQFYVEEHTCPTNLVPVAAIVTEGDTDPHGVFELVGHTPKRDYLEDEPSEGWLEIIERARGDL